MLTHINRRRFLSLGTSFLTLPMVAQLFGCGGSENPEPEKKIFKDPKFELLDIALQHEFGAIVQYGNHAGIIQSLDKDAGKSKGKCKVIENIIGHEVHHAILITDMLKQNGIEPTVAVWPPQTAATPDEMIQKDIAAETSAIKLYQQILSLDFDDRIKKSIETIKLSEEMHHNMFTAMLS